VSEIYVTGHLNPDTDSIAAAIGYAELKRRLDPRNDYVPVRLGECNPQTRWMLERSGAPEPAFLPHVMLRACDVMQTSFPVTRHDQPVREAGLEIARAELELVPVVDGEGALLGVVTERALARRYIREYRHVSTLEDAPTQVSRVAEVLEGELVTGGDHLLAGRVWVHSMDPAGFSGISVGDIVVFHYPGDTTRDFIKRVIGLPGDNISVRHQRVYVNDIPLNEAYLPSGNAPAYDFGPYKVKKGDLFVLGDNRNNSYDSHTWGIQTPLHDNLVIGKALMAYWPLQDFEFYGRPSYNRVR